MAEYAVAYKVKWASGNWDDTPRAVRVLNGHDLDLILEKIRTEDTLMLHEIREYDPMTMFLPIWKDGADDRHVKRTIYLYQEYREDYAYGEELNLTFMDHDNAEEKMKENFMEFCDDEFGERPKSDDNKVIEEFLEDMKMDEITVTDDEISFLINMGDDKVWFRITETITEDEDPIIEEEK